MDLGILPVAGSCNSLACTGPQQKRNGMANACIELRRLGKSEIAELRDLLGVFGRAFSQPETYLSAQPSDDYIETLLSDDRFVVISAFFEGRTVGGLAAYVLQKYERPRSEVYIYDLAVDERFRRRGIATSLIEELKSVASKLGAYVIFVQADYVDDAAVQLYSKLGDREDVLHFDIMVPQSPGPMQ